MQPSATVFLKLGGSLITNKQAVEAVQDETLQRLAQEIADVRRKRPHLRLLLSHGSGSFGHAAAARYQTQKGVHSPEEWHGFCEVSDTAARLNRLVCNAMLNHDIPTASFQPSASAICEAGEIVEMATAPIEAALNAGIVPLVYGDVAFDKRWGGTIISTETILSRLAVTLQPAWLLLAGNTPGVLDESGDPIPHISHHNVQAISGALGGSAGTDVTGGMRTKVHDMLALVTKHPGLSVRIFSGMEENRLHDVLMDPGQPAGTRISS